MINLDQLIFHWKFVVIVMFANLFEVKGYTAISKINIILKIIFYKEESSKSITQKPHYIPIPCFKGWNIFLILGGCTKLIYLTFLYL